MILPIGQKSAFDYKLLVVSIVEAICMPFSRLLGQHIGYHTGIGVAVSP